MVQCSFSNSYMVPATSLRSRCFRRSKFFITSRVVVLCRPFSLADFELSTYTHIFKYMYCNHHLFRPTSLQAPLETFYLLKVTTKHFFSHLVPFDMPCSRGIVLVLLRTNPLLFHVFPTLCFIKLLVYSMSFRFGLP